MSNSNNPPSSSPPSPSTKKSQWPFTFLTITISFPVILAAIAYQLDSFDPGAYPIEHTSSKEPMYVPKRNSNMLEGVEKIGEGKLLGPEDIAYDKKMGVIYTGCSDGWIKIIKLGSNLVVEEWVNTGGRPLGMVLGQHGELVVADADEGMLNITADGKIHLLTKEAEGLEFKLADGVDIAENGILYFTDASYKYKFKEYIWDILEGRPYGRLLSYDPQTKVTKVLVRDLYFANGVVVSPDQKKCCKRYHIEGEKRGSVDMFIENIPGTPDNVMYDGEGYYWIALTTGQATLWDLALKYPFIRKIMGIIEKTVGRPHMEKNGGALAIDLEGRPVAHYYDQHLSMVSSSIKIGDHLYCGSVAKPYMIRLNLTQHPAVADA
ncbi:hypothetical protein Leryth_013003 [Lithospermum erythrorhizon]|nr:hypothetical protein Leryth_013003 [Lithospermum erythrorhizon]